MKSKTFKFILVGLILGIFLLEASQAYAIMGTRIARRAAATREAKQALAKNPDSDTEKGTRGLGLLGRRQAENEAND